MGKMNSVSARPNAKVNQKFYFKSNKMVFLSFFWELMQDSAVFVQKIVKKRLCFIRTFSCTSVFEIIHCTCRWESCTIFNTRCPSPRQGSAVVLPVPAWCCPSLPGAACPSLVLPVPAWCCLSACSWGICAAFMAPPDVAERAQSDGAKHAELFIRLGAFESVLLIKQQKKRLRSVEM